MKTELSPLTGFDPPVLHALNAVDNSASMHAEHDLLPPGQLFHRVFVRVVETGARLANQARQAVSSHETPTHDEQDAALRDTLLAFLHSLAGYLEACRSVIVCLAPNGKDRERMFASFRRSIAQYHAHVMMLINHIKHRHRMLRTVYGLWLAAAWSATRSKLPPAVASSGKTPHSMHPTPRFPSTGTSACMLATSILPLLR
ncbi:hypothetical protein [Luteibacter aegosomatissinici]|uniref:hypothetical protein n=1 Tax=Luteibacter aegosomatissinici TaxID=2911539 RepID=UPI001FFBC79D|nr:hypothetical protein [Luteibacter aegosomatissinici]UPG92827.1 hypothetical protein L2Y97_13225 [Luteibacter aegosomatissinici]